MGHDSKRAPPLPAPTETESLSTPTELTADVSRPQEDEKSSFSLPDDGTPVTIKTRGHKANRSQTSLLIEYFEGGKNPDSPEAGSSTNRKPSVRVRLTPSKNRGKNDHIQITETKSSRKTSSSRRATDGPLVPSRSELDVTDPDDTRSMNSYASATEESNVSRHPIEVDISTGPRRRRERKASSPLIPAADSKASSYIPPNMSDISAIPTDSFLDGSGGTTTVSREERYSKSPSGGDALAAGALGAVAAAVVADKMNRKSRSESHDRKIIEKAVEKATRPDRKHKTKSRTSSISEKEIEGKLSPRRKSKSGNKDSLVSAADSSMLSSQMTPSHRSYDSHSSSKVSINNPKLLETVEDAIRRLILPELESLKRERSQRDTRRSKDRDSLSSLTSASREELSATSRRRSGDTTQSTKSRGREARNDLSPHSSVEHVSVHESGYNEEDTPRRGKDRLSDAVLLGAGAAAGAAGMAAANQERARIDDKRQRRRRRAKTPERGMAVEEYDEVEHEVIPPMPLASEINPSEMTRTSILSANTDRPHSASEEMTPVQEVSRGVASMESIRNTPTPTRTSSQTLQGLGAQHANISHGDLKALPRKGLDEYDEEYEDSEVSQRHPVYREEYEEEFDDAGHLAEPGMYESGNSFFGSQDVPSPLRYVPYQQERRGLSPIQSVSGYTEGESDIHHRRDSRATHSELSSPDKSSTHEHRPHSSESVPSNMRSREFGDEDASLRSSGHYRDTRYTDDSELDRVTSGQAVRGIGANPEFVHQPFSAESAVASLVDGSIFEPSLLSGGQDYRDSQLSQNYRDSQISYDEGEHEQGLGGASPAKRSFDSRREVFEEREHSPALSKQTRSDASREFEEELELDDYGQKVRQSQYRRSPTASEQAITNAALTRAAAAAIKAKYQGPNPQSSEESHGQWTGDGVGRHRSFKERAIVDGYRPDVTPRHSIDRLSEDYDHPKLGASGLPDVNHPMPEIGYGYDQENTPSVVQGPLGGSQHDSHDHWPEEPTPTQEKTFSYDRATTPKASDKGSGHGGHGLGITETAAAASLAAAAGMAASHSRQPSQEQDDEWQRTSGERKRDTLLTNPYEGTSPIANLPGLDNGMMGTSGFGHDTYRGGFHTGSPGMHPGDEGYETAQPNEIRNGQDKGKGVEFQSQALVNNNEDPFYSSQNHTRHLSGMSQGMASPLYDSAMGTGIDRIQSKDIVFLMEHVSCPLMFILRVDANRK